MLTWFLASLCWIFGALATIRAVYRIFSGYQTRNSIRVLQLATRLFQRAEETLQAGLTLSPNLLQEIRELDSPWGPLASESLRELRGSGASLTPTLRRFRMLAQDLLATTSKSKSQAAQALSQAILCLGLCVLLAFGLPGILPELKEIWVQWACFSLLANGLAVLGALWILRLADQAKWAGLRGNERDWPITFFCLGESLLALIRAGNTPDSAWTRCLGFLSHLEGAPLNLWPVSVWSEPVSRLQRGPSAASALEELGVGLIRGIQTSLFEGKPCLDRLENSLQASRLELQGITDRELALVPTRSLQPLFLCIAPAALLLLGSAVALVAGPSLWGGP